LTFGVSFGAFFAVTGFAPVVDSRLVGFGKPSSAIQRREALLPAE
jgi:hypothetical protein